MNRSTIGNGNQWVCGLCSPAWLAPGLVRVLIGSLAVLTLPAVSVPLTRSAQSAEPTSVAEKPSATDSGWTPAPVPLASRWAAQVRSDAVWSEYPRPQLVRRPWLSLNGLWELGFANGPIDPPVDKTLPHRILVPFCVESSLSGLHRRAERVWYRREFSVPKAWAGQRVLLHFGAVDWEATVHVNGHRLGTHRGGYDPFSFDITDQLTGEGPQELLVGVFDPSDSGGQPRGKQDKRPRGIYYTPCTGIWQTVWLEPVPPAHIEELRFTPDIDASCLRLLVRGHNTTPIHTVRAEVQMDGKTLVRAYGGVGADIRLEIPPEKLRLWSPDDPHLYDLKLTLLQGELTIDEVESYFAMREVGLQQDDQGRARIVLNGEPLFQMGLLDQGYWPAGVYTPPSDEAQRADIEAAKRLGFNMIRKHVKVEPSRWYYWCDRLGMLVWQDMPSATNPTAADHQQFELELRRMIESLRNHPSIIGWVVFNEGWGQPAKKGEHASADWKAETTRYVDTVRRLDSTRLIDAASGWNDPGSGDVVDRHGYPGPPEVDAEADRAAMVGEFGGLGLAVPGHTWTKDRWGYRMMNNSAQLTARYESLVANIWRMARQKGLSAAVYTQLTDVEAECNGLLTYDRAILKVDLSRVAAANRGLEAKTTVLVPVAQPEARSAGNDDGGGNDGGNDGATGDAPDGSDNGDASTAPRWRYSFNQPPAPWIETDFDDSRWSVGPGGFGTPGTPAARVGTNWSGSDIWLRREFHLPEDFDRSSLADRLWLLLHHDEDVEVYLNGELALAAGGFTVEYRRMPIRTKAREKLHAGRNVMAIHCRNSRGGQFIDAGLVEVDFQPME